VAFDTFDFVPYDYLSLNLLRAYHCLSQLKISKSNTLSLQLDHTTGTHTVRYQGTADWDCAIEANDSPVDVSLALPHYRTRHQPAEHKLSMFVATRSAPIRAKIVRLVLLRPELVPSAHHTHTLSVPSCRLAPTVLSGSHVRERRGHTLASL
jgi:hypothetical protein